MSDDHGPWQPAATTELVGLFSGAPFRWWISGGVALELHVGRSWRDHEDADVGICRADAQAAHRWLAGLCLYIAAGGRLRPWDGRPLSAEDAENNVWAKDEADGPWRFDIAIGDGDADTWIYRRERAVHRPYSEAILTTAAGVPYLAPEIQLLFKSQGPRDKDHADAGQVIPRLEPLRSRWLRDHLPPGHHWLRHWEPGAAP